MAKSALKLIKKYNWLLISVLAILVCVVLAYFYFLQFPKKDSPTPTTGAENQNSTTNPLTTGYGTTGRIVSIDSKNNSIEIETFIAPKKIYRVEIPEKVAINRVQTPVFEVKADGSFGPSTIPNQDAILEWEELIIGLLVDFTSKEDPGKTGALTATSVFVTK